MIELIVTLFLAAFFYLTVPLIIGFRKKEMSKKQIRKTIIINGFAVWFIIVLLNISIDVEPPSYPSILWMWIGYIILEKKFMSKKENTQHLSDATLPDESTIYAEVKSVDTTSQYPVISQGHSQMPDNIKPHKNSKKKTVAIVVLSILLALSTVFSVFMVIGSVGISEEYETQIAELQEDLDSKSEAYNSAHESLIKYRDYYEDNYAKVDMMNSNIVFVIEGYGNYYYTYDQMMIATLGDAEYAYCAYNIEQAKGLGYIPWK